MSLLSIKDVGKAFCSYSAEWKRFARWFGVPTQPNEEHWVLRHINFEIQTGEAVGIIGQNGAGKSTLLKMITGTLQPTEGSIQINGRIAAILELGMGFNPELSGRQNVLHAAGLMGFGLDQIQQAMPDIEAFAEIGEYFDQPVRIYSSGMQMRVAFSVVTAFRPEILIVDEALSVGDAYFQHKSFNRIREFQEEGTTLLIVSHDRGAIQSLCDRAILLESGAVIKDGKPEEVFDFYNALIAEKENVSSIKVSQLADGSQQTSSGTGQARVTDVQLVNDTGDIIEFVDVGQVVTLRLAVEVYDYIPRLIMGYGIKDRLGQVVYGTNTDFKEQEIIGVGPDAKLTYEVTFSANLGPGSYSIQTALVSSDTHLQDNYEWRDLALVFNVINVNKQRFAGSAWMDPTIEISRS